MRDLGRYINTFGATKITFELIDLFRLNEDNNDLYRATLIQHWMYEGRNSYLDSDFLAIDVRFVDGTPLIVRRHAGRGAFNIFSDPAGIEISMVNGHEWTDADEARVTPFRYIINAPLQHHKVVSG